MKTYKNNSKVLKSFKVGGRWIEVQPGCTITLMQDHVVQSDPDMVEVSKSVSKYVPEPVYDKVTKPVSKSESELEDMTKDELNDYGALIGLAEINSRMTKSEMVNKILRYQDAK